MISLIGAVSLSSGWILVSIVALVFSRGRGMIIVNQVAFFSGTRTLVLNSSVLNRPSFQRGVGLILRYIQISKR
jgi:hypothetical protein